MALRILLPPPYCFVESLRDIRDRIIYLIRTLVLKDYYLFLKNDSNINQRQYDLLILMLG